MFNWKLLSLNYSTLHFVYVMLNFSHLHCVTLSRARSISLRHFVHTNWSICLTFEYWKPFYFLCFCLSFPLRAAATLFLHANHWYRLNVNSMNHEKAREYRDYVRRFKSSSAWALAVVCKFHPSNKSPRHLRETWSWFRCLTWVNPRLFCHCLLKKGNKWERGHRFCRWG